MLANGIRDEGVKVYVEWGSRISCSWRGSAYYMRPSYITITVGQGIDYPCPIIDYYMERQVRLADLKAAPRIATSPQELIGFIFIHELHHIRQFRKREKKNEAKCTRWAYNHWKPMPPEMLEAARVKAQETEQKEAIRGAERSAREAAKNAPAAKLAALEARVKKIDTRMKRLVTSRKKLARSIAYYRRERAPKVKA
jgi:hypothetical protein